MREIFINDLSFLVQCLHSVPDSYCIVTYFVSDMPSVFIGTIFTSDRECEEILLQKILPWKFRIPNPKNSRVIYP